MMHSTCLFQPASFLGNRTHLRWLDTSSPSKSHKVGGYTESRVWWWKAPPKETWPPTLPETNIASENGWLEYDRFLLGWPIFRDKLLVSGRVSVQKKMTKQIDEKIVKRETPNHLLSKKSCFVPRYIREGLVPNTSSSRIPRISNTGLV